MEPLAFPPLNANFIVNNVMLCRLNSLILLWNVTCSCKKTKSGLHEQLGKKELSDPLVILSDFLWSVQTPFALDSTLDRVISATMGAVLSTPYMPDSRIIFYKCTSPMYSDELDYCPLSFSPLLSSIYDPEKIITISDSEDSDWHFYLLL